MNKSDAYLRYQNIQKLKQVLSGEPNFARAVATRLYDSSYRGALKKILFAFFLRPKFSIDKLDASWLFVYSFKGRKRKDYDRVVSTVRDIMPEHGYLEINEQFSPFFAFMTIAKIRIFLRKLDSIELGRCEKIIVSALLSKYEFIYEEEIEPIMENFSGVVTFSDAFGYENLFAQAANNSSKKSITCQHGQYRCLNESNISADAEAYENFISQKMLAWGQATVSEFAKVGVDPERFTICGNLGRDHLSKLRSKRDNGGKPGLFGVILNGENGQDTNIELIEIANVVSSHSDIDFVVRMHPDNSKAFYKGFVGRRCVGLSVYDDESYYQTIDFSIGHMSATILHCLEVGSPLFVYGNKLPEVYSPMSSIIFNTSAELIQLLDKYDEESYFRKTHEISVFYNDTRNYQSHIRRVFGAI